MKSWAFAALFVSVGVFAACSTKAITNPGGNSICGDGICDIGEDSSSCPADCGTSSSSSSSGTSTSSSTSSGSTSSSTSSGSTSSSTSSGNTSSSSSGSSGGTCDAPQTTADCTSCATKAACEPQGAASCCETANTPGAQSYSTILLTDAVCEAGGACLAKCNGAGDYCANPPGMGTQGCVDCVNALPASDPGIVKFLADCKADANCLDYGQCISACSQLP